MGNPTFCPLVSTGCSLRISGCQHITPAYSDFFPEKRKKENIFSLLPSAWNVIIRPGTHCYFIVWQLQNKIEILHICCPESLCKILCWESVWSCISLGSLATKCSDLSLQQPLCPVPWKEAVAQHPAAQPTGCSRPGLQEKNTRQI